MKKMRVDELVFVCKNILLSIADESLIKAFYNSVSVVKCRSGLHVQQACIQIIILKKTSTGRFINNYTKAYFELQ